LTTANPLPQTDSAPPPPRQPANGAWKRGLATWSRWLHVYLSMASFAILFFFAVTGLTLNHTEWFAGAQRAVQSQGTADRSWLGPQVAKLEIVEHLRRAHSVRGALSDFRIDETQCAVSFKGPGYTADAFIDRATGRYEFTETRMGFAAVMNDLHKGRDSGRAWSWLIDISAVLMSMVSISGTLLIFFLPKRRAGGLLAAAIGAAMCLAAYAVWVP
jgi:uncharacterized protein